MRWLFVLSSVLLASGGIAPAAVDFASEVRPILNTYCVGCHGGVKQAGGVSFVYRDQVLGPAKSGHTVVVPGDLEASELIYRITTDDEEDRMPPVEEHPEGLNQRDIEVLKQWVREGAAWGEHWAFVPPQPTPVPDVDDSDWVRNAVDAFVLSRLEQEGVDPAPDADPDQWLRRVSLDLVGLPPSIEERERFLKELADNGEPAYAAAVDRLLMSPGFGERWAAVWLDQVRYADSKGLGQDGRRNIWKYRDWVIQAFNRDLPYDEFTRLQIAGDLLPHPTLGDRVATAVHRLTQSNEEGGTDDEEFRIAAVIDRVSTTWQTWQGITFGCVQCHSHPYDPIRHEEFYEFMAFFNNTADTDLDEEWPVARVPLDPADEAEAQRLDERIARLRHQIWNEEFAALSDAFHWRPLKELTAESSLATRLAVENRGEWDEYHTVGTVERNSDFTLEAPIPSGMDRLTAVRFTGLPLDPAAAVADSEWGFVLSHVEAFLVGTSDAEPVPLEFGRVIGDEPEPFHDPNDSLNPKNGRGFGAYSRIHYPRQAALVLKSPVEVPDGARLRMVVKHRVYLLGAFPLIARRGHLAVSDSEVFVHLAENPGLNDQRRRLAALESRREQIESTPIPVLKERPDRLARPTHVFGRGLFLTKEEQVSPDVPGLFAPLPKGVAADRRALAEWLVSPENPLTARVAVNRFWARLFGVGLVATEEDFGSSGEPPSHPALLDYLALRFQNELGWSMKSLLREWVLSRTYRQSGRQRPELAERDPANRLLARGPRFRLPAEIVRDQALAIADLLNRDLFGPPARPPIPEGVWLPFQGGDKWDTPEPGEPGRYRRSIYTYTKRSIPYPMFASFDAPSREFCTPRRLRSNTPLQALMMLNDETLVECARSLGRRMEQAEGSLSDKLAYGYRIAAGREADAARVAELRALFETAQSAYWSRPEQTEKLGLEPDAAAFAMVATALLNLDEVLMK